MHELKHIIDGGHTTKARHTGSPTGNEGLCTDFALSVLIPAAWLRADWQAGQRDLHALAERYQVPELDMAHRLRTVGLTTHAPPRRPRARCHWQPHIKHTRAAARREALIASGKQRKGGNNEKGQPR